MDTMCVPAVSMMKASSFCCLPCAPFDLMCNKKTKCRCSGLCAHAVWRECQVNTCASMHIIASFVNPRVNQMHHQHFRLDFPSLEQTGTVKNNMRTTLFHQNASNHGDMGFGRTVLLQISEPSADVAIVSPRTDV